MTKKQASKAKKVESPERDLITRIVEGWKTLGTELKTTELSKAFTVVLKTAERLGTQERKELYAAAAKGPEAVLAYITAREPLYKSLVQEAAGAGKTAYGVISSQADALGDLRLDNAMQARTIANLQSSNELLREMAHKGVLYEREQKRRKMERNRRARAAEQVRNYAPAEAPMPRREDVEFVEKLAQKYKAE